MYYIQEVDKPSFFIRIFNIIKLEGNNIFVPLIEIENSKVQEKLAKKTIKIFENLKTSEDSKIFKKIVEEKPKKIKDFYEYIDTSKLKIKSKEEFEIVEKILFTITTKAIVMRFKYKSKEEARKNYLKQLKYLKYGIMKQERRNA